MQKSNSLALELMQILRKLFLSCVIGGDKEEIKAWG